MLKRLPVKGKFFSETVQKPMIRLIVFLTKREPPSSRLRFRSCKEEFLNNDIEPTFIPIQSGLIGRLRLLKKCKDFDVVIIQKKTSFREFELFLMKLLNPNIIFDYDDAVMFHELEHGQSLTGKNAVKFFRTIKYCRAVIAGNRFLAEFASCNCADVHVLSTPVDTQKYKIKDYSIQAQQIFIGWIGVSGNLKYLEMIKPVLKEISKKHKNIVLKIISDAFISMDGVRVQFKKWRIEEEIENLRTIDIGIMPLDDSLWAKGKCGYKILQYMGVGVPVVVSPVGINVELIKHNENGFLASSPEEWSKYLDILIVNSEKRQKMGLKGRQIVEEMYNVKKYSKEYCKVIKKIFEKNESVEGRI